MQEEHLPTAGNGGGRLAEAARHVWGVCRPMTADRLARGFSIVEGSVVESAEPEDEALAVRGDADSFVLLYRRYLTPVYRYLYARIGNSAEAEDVTSVAWERVVESLPGYRPTGSFRAWLFTVASRALADHYRHRKAAPAPIDDLCDDLPDNREGPEEAALLADEGLYVLGVI